MGFDVGKAGAQGDAGFGGKIGFGAKLGNVSQDLQKGKIFEGKGFLPGGGNLKIGKVAFGGKADMRLKAKLASERVLLEKTHVKAPKSLLGNLVKSGKKVKFVVAGGLLKPSATVADEVTLTIIADEQDDNVNIVVGGKEMPTVLEIVTVHAEKADGSLDGKFDIGKVGFDLGKIGFGTKAEGHGKIGFGGVGLDFGGKIGFGAKLGNVNDDLQKGKVFEGKGLLPGGGNLKIGKVGFGGKADLGLKAKLGSVKISLDEKHVKAPKSLVGKLTGKITNIWQFGRDLAKLGKKVKFVVGGDLVIQPGVTQGGIAEVTIIADEQDNNVNIVVGGNEFPSALEIVTVHAEKADGSLDGNFDIGKAGFDLGKIGFKAKAKGEGEVDFGGSLGFGGGGSVGFGGQAGFGGSFGGKIGFGAKLGNVNDDLQKGKVFEGKGLLPGGGNLKIGKVAFGGKADVGLRGKLGSVNISLDEKHVKAPKSLLGKLSGKISSIWQFGRDLVKAGKKVKFVVGGGVLVPPLTATSQYLSADAKVTIIPDENSNEDLEILTVQADASVGGEFDVGKMGLDLGKEEDLGKIGFGNNSKDLEKGSVVEGQGSLAGGFKAKIGKVSFGGQADMGLKGKLGALNITLDEKHVKGNKASLGELSGKQTNIIQFAKDMMKKGKKVKIVVGGLLSNAADKAKSLFGYYKDGKSNNVTNVTEKNGVTPTKGLKYRSNMEETYRQSSEENENNEEEMEHAGRVSAFPQNEDAEQTVVLEEMCGLAPGNFTLAATKGYCVFLKWDPPKNEELAPFDFYITEVENTEENQWKIYHASRNHITSMKLCGLEPGDHRFRMRTWTNNQCQYSEPSNIITLEQERGKSRQHFF
ncbi:uncharacterized protein CDAR_376031 [Caerostris darwini]|uniref:Fibronectin type-III domain-containing protein n=1 Tax=Caerostris darwini TaxID=1538125 RepID=A0AAV4UI39_9ARAC|nr:uncharacterized protein CDAR_376031 [Caerostris darwini]